MNRPALALASLLLVGCPPSNVDVYPECIVAIAPAPAVAAPGDTVALTGGPFSELWDTVVRVSGVEAVVLDVTREDCDACDDCRDEADGCLTCGECASCDDACADCVQTVSFVVPDVPPGDAVIVLIDRYGQSAATPLTVTGEEPDTDPADTDADDSDAADTDTDAAAP